MVPYSIDLGTVNAVVTKFAEYIRPLQNPQEMLSPFPQSILGCLRSALPFLKRSKGHNKNMKEQLPTVGAKK